MLIVLLLTLLQIIHSNAYQSDRILMTDIQALTFTSQAMTTGRRSSPVPQLICVGGSARSSKFLPSVVQCRNVGHDGYNVEWACSADLDESVRFGPVTVACEGYSSSEDPYVLRGSCALEYTLEYTSKGQQNQHSQNSHGSSYHYPQHDSYGEGGYSNFGSFLTFIVLVIAIFGLLTACSNSRQQGGYGGAPQQHGGPGMGAPGGPGGYGNGGYGNNDGSGNDGYGGGPGYGGGGAGTGFGSGFGSGSTGVGGGGFWSGLATGGLLSYLFRPRFGGGYGGFNSFGGGFGGYGGYRGYGNGYGSGYGSGLGGGYTSSYTSGMSGSSSPSFSSGTTTRSASGYGGSRRR